MNPIFSLSGTILKSNVTALSRPFKLTYAVTYRCNSRCKICSIWKRKKFKELTIPEVDSFFRNNTYFNWIDVTGGEVLLKPDFLSIIKIILSTQKNLYLLHTQTNGILPSTAERTVRDIIKLKPNKFILTISLDGPPAVHDTLRGIKNNWLSAVNTYKRLMPLFSGRFSCVFGMTLSGYNSHLVEKTFQSLKSEIPSLSRHDLHFNIAHHSVHYYGNAATPLGDKTQIPDAIRRYNEKKPFVLSSSLLLERLYQTQIPKYLKTGKTPVPCKALRSSLFLDPDGTVFPCTMWNFPLGNIRDMKYDLTKFWQSELAAKTRHVIDRKKCPNCWTPCEAYQTIVGNLKTVLSQNP